MARKNRRKDKHVPLEQIIAPTPEQMARGGYAIGTVSDDDGRKWAAYTNAHHDPVSRWMTAGKIDSRQKAVIDTVRRLWDRVGLKQRLTASYGERMAGGSIEVATAATLDARDDLARIEGYFAGLRPYWAVFENVCRFGENAGIAGSALGMGTTGNEARAHLIVCFVADFIAARERI